MQIQCAYLLSALLLGQHFFFLGNYLRLVLQTEREGKPDQQGGSCHDPDDVSDDFSALLDERRGGGDF